ncbi:hypothetical protein ACVWY3_004916 [Bradyrhizobium sp. USDA 4486]
MRPKKHRTTGSGDLFRARLDQIINMKHELVQLAGKVDWDWIDGEIAPLYSENGRPGIATRFMIGLLLLKHIYGLSDEGVCERWVHDPYFQYFTGKEFFQHAFPHERSDLSHWRKRLGDKLELLLAESLRVAHEAGALRSQDLKRVTVDTTVQPKAITFSTNAQALARGDQRAQPSGEEARGQAAAVLSAHCHNRDNDGGTLRPCQAIQAASAAVCASCAADWAGSSAISAARSKVRLCWRTRSPSRSAGPRRSARSSSASAASSFIPSTPRWWSASARAKQPRLTS